MHNPKIDRLNDEVEKVKVKIAELRKKLRVLEKQKTDIENEEIVIYMRSEKISDSELSELRRSLRSNVKDKEPATTRVLEHNKTGGTALCK